MAILMFPPAGGRAPAGHAKSEDSSRQSRGGRVALRRRRRSSARRGARRARSGLAARALPRSAGRRAEAVIINTAGGMAGGDRFAARRRGRGRRTRSSSPPRRPKRSIARSDRDTEIDVSFRSPAGGTLAWLPQETILFDRARLSRTHRRRSRAGCAAVARRSDRLRTLRPGRDDAAGPLFDRWRIRRDGQLVFAETCGSMSPIAARLAHPAVAGRRRDGHRPHCAWRRRSACGGARARDYSSARLARQRWNGIAARAAGAAMVRRCGTTSPVLPALGGGAAAAVDQLTGGSDDESDAARERQAADLHGRDGGATAARTRRQAQPSGGHRADHRLHPGRRARRPHRRRTDGRPARRCSRGRR